MMEKDYDSCSPRGGSENMFPGRLHDLLEYVESQNMSHIVSWCRNGTAFMVHRPDELLQLLSFYFGQTKYRSFTRQLNMWSFEREEYGQYKGAYHHPYFLQHNRKLCAKMSRNGSREKTKRFLQAIEDKPYKSIDHQDSPKANSLCSPADFSTSPSCSLSNTVDYITGRPCDNILFQPVLRMPPKEPETMHSTNLDHNFSPRFELATDDLSSMEPTPLVETGRRTRRPSSTIAIDDALFSIGHVLEPNPIQERRASFLNFAALFNNKPFVHEAEVAFPAEPQQQVVEGGESGTLFNQDDDELYLLRLLQRGYSDSK